MTSPQQDAALSRHYGRVDSFPPYVGGDDDTIDEWQGVCDCGWEAERRWSHVTGAHMDVLKHLNGALAAAVAEHTDERQEKGLGGSGLNAAAVVEALRDLSDYVGGDWYYAPVELEERVRRIVAPHPVGVNPRSYVAPGVTTPYREEDAAGLTAADAGAAVTTGERDSARLPEVAVDGSAVAVRLAAIRATLDRCTDANLELPLDAGWLIAKDVPWLLDLCDQLTEAAIAAPPAQYMARAQLAEGRVAALTQALREAVVALDHLAAMIDEHEGWSGDMRTAFERVWRLVSGGPR